MLYKGKPRLPLHLILSLMFGIRKMISKVKTKENKNLKKKKKKENKVQDNKMTHRFRTSHRNRIAKQLPRHSVVSIHGNSLVLILRLRTLLKKTGRY